MSGVTKPGAIVTSAPPVRRLGMHATPSPHAAAPAPLAHPSSPGPLIILGLPIAVQVFAMFVLVGIDTPLRPWVLRTMERPMGVVLLSGIGLAVVVAVMLVVLGWIEWRQKRQRQAR
jgi:hypothetical protein